MSAPADAPEATQPTSASQAMHPHFHPKRKSRGRRIFEAAMALLLVVIGIVIGAGMTVLYLDRHPPGPPRPKNIAENIVNTMSKKLSLTPDELEAAEKIAATRMDAVDAIRKDAFQRIRMEFLAMSDDFEDLLGSERADLWEADLQERFGDRKWMKSRLEHRKKRKDGHAPPAPAHERR
jgi:hypothetical protein